MHIHFEGSLTTRDGKRHIPHTFDLPAGCHQLEITFHFSPHRIHNTTNLLTLTLFDPDGFRGAGHRSGDTHHVKIDSLQATPGYLPGALPTGAWIVQIDTHMIMPGEPIQYQLDITTTDGPTTRGDPQRELTASTSVQPARGPGWYRGDLHSHTYHSDAGKRSVAELVQTARDYGLDFIFLTDHNTISGLDEIKALGSEDLLTAGGLELTTFWGHALCLGTREWIDWRIRPGTGEISRLAAATYANDQLFIIAHPNAIGDPKCTGCAWRYGEMMPGNAGLVEIWNGPWSGESNNEATLSLWYDWLNQGRRIVATAGTDTHGVQHYAKEPGFSVVYAPELSQQALLRSIRAGHLYLSSGPRLTLEAHSDSGASGASGASGEHWIMGDTVTRPVRLATTWADCPPGARLRLLANGKLMEENAIAPEGAREWRLAPEQLNWATIELRSDEGELLAITNPVFFEVLE